jgi:ubiquinone/menaquinone biosynthesis C-methylase UbiE
MTDAARREHWQQGVADEGHVGRRGRRVAAELLGWPASAPGLARVDVGCGTGALGPAILERSPASRLGEDPAAGLLEVARLRVDGRPARLAIGDARARPLAGALVDRAVSGLVLNLVPKRPRRPPPGDRPAAPHKGTGR